MQVLKAHFGDGSSPLTRGKLECDVSEGIGRGIIPAHAGKTYDGLIPALRSGDHPRSRGENIAPCFHIARDAGSSPLTRGKPSGAVPRRARTRDHPRSRGENSSAYFFVLAVSGSSPLTRGKRLRKEAPRER